MAEGYMKQLGFKNMVSDGGNGITINEQLISIKPLDYDLCVQLIHECEAKGIPWAFSPTNESYRLAPNDDFMNFTHDDYLPTIVKPNVKPEDYQQIYKVYVAFYKEDEAKLETLKYLPYARFHKEYIFVEPCDKSVGIKAICDYFHAPYKDVVVFGDETNDLSMFNDEWTCIAMGNGVDALKQKATYVTSDVDKDGIYNACVHFGWIEGEMK